MTSSAREFVHATTRSLDRLLTTLTEDEQHDLLDALAAEIEERLDALVAREEATAAS